MKSSHVGYNIARPMKQTPRFVLWQAKAGYSIARPMKQSGVQSNENVSISESTGNIIARPMKQAPRGDALAGKSEL